MLMLYRLVQVKNLSLVNLSVCHLFFKPHIYCLLHFKNSRSPEFLRCQTVQLRGRLLKMFPPARIPEFELLNIILKSTFIHLQTDPTFSDDDCRCAQTGREDQSVTN